MAKAVRWGNSLALRIPGTVARELGIEENTQLEVSASRGRLVVTPVKGTYTLEQLLAGVCKDNLHAESDIGSPAGCEVL